MGQITKAVGEAGKQAGKIVSKAGSGFANGASKAGSTTAQGVNNAAHGMNHAANNFNNLGKNPGLGNNKPGFGDKPGLNKNNNGFGNKDNLNKKSGLNNKNNGDSFRKRMSNKSLFNRPSPFSLKNYKQRLENAKAKRAERGAEPESIGAYIGAIPFMVKAAICSFAGFIILTIFAVVLIVTMADEESKLNAFLHGAVVVSGTLSNVSTAAADAAGNAIDVTAESFSFWVDAIQNIRLGNTLNSLAHNFGHNFTNGNCDGDDCNAEYETQYYQKVADLTFRYKKLYGVELAWSLLYTSNIYGSDNGDFFKNNVGGYDRSDVNNLDKVMSLDWEYDYENMDDYTYLAKDDYTYDLQILAKNMVKKKTTQQCVTLNSEGQVVTVLAKKEVEDVLDADLVSGNENYLVCTTGTYQVKSEYVIDTDKFDEFLLEYLDSRIYGVKGNNLKRRLPGNNNGNNNGSSTIVTPGEWGWPLPIGATSCRSSLYGYRIHPITGEQHFHSGDDYPAATGTSVYAIGDGTVIDINTSCVVGNMNCGGGAGNYVKIDHGGGVVSIYMHASSVLVTRGQRVSRGDEIMKVGSTGSSTGPHLHITLRLNGQLDAPMNYIGALPKC